LYFAQQVFAVDERWPHLQHPDGFPFEGKDKDTQPRPERFVVLFTERAIDLSSAAKECLVPTKYESLSTARPPDGPISPSTAPLRRKSSSNLKVTSPTADPPTLTSSQPVDPLHCPLESSVLLVLTDATFYLVAHSSVSERSVRFAQAPRPMVLCHHPLRHLSACTIFFGSQRFVLNFNVPVSAPVPATPSLSVGAGIGSSSDSVDSPRQVEDEFYISQQYMIITRDKQRTFPIITRLTRLANACRQQQLQDARSLTQLLQLSLGAASPSSSSLSSSTEQVSVSDESVNVKIFNKDSQLLEVLQRCSQSLMERMHVDSISCDILHYQMVYHLVKGSSAHSGGGGEEMGAVGLRRSSTGTGDVIGLQRNNSLMGVSRASLSSMNGGGGGGGSKRSAQQQQQFLPRTVIVTETCILLCTEELNCNDVRLVVVDCARLKDLVKVSQSPLVLNNSSSAGDGDRDGEEDKERLAASAAANGVTLLFRSANVFSSRRKWKLCTDSPLLSGRLAEECRRLAKGL
jgi:hypothetical protein